MGCKKSVLENSLSVENAMISKYEKSLKLNKVSSLVYEAYIRRILQSDQPFPSAFKKMTLNLNLEIPEELSTESIQNWASALLFMVLLGGGSETEKLDILWYSADLGIENDIDKNTLYKLFENLIESACLITVNALVTIETSEDLKNRLVYWKDQASEKKTAAADQLTAFYIEDRQTISKKEFQLKTQQKFFGGILTLTHLRCIVESVKVIPKKFANAFKKK